MDAAVVATQIGGLGVIIAIDVEHGWVIGAGKDAMPVMIERVSVFALLGTCTWVMGATVVGVTVARVDSVVLAANLPCATRSRTSCAYDSLSNWSN